MNILLTNDDGIDAPGILAAQEALAGLGQVHVIAPRTQRSACSHTITLSRTIAVEPMQHATLGPVHAVDGTPADCVRLAVAALLEEPVDLLISGINAGANSGVDVFYSGTVAAAREGAILGIRAIAISQGLRQGLETDWSAATRVSGMIIRELLKEALPGPGFWSVNLPPRIPNEPRNHVHRVPVSIQPTPLGFVRTNRPDGRLMEFDYDAAYWRREVDGPSDYSVIRDGGIAISAIPLHGRF